MNTRRSLPTPIVLLAGLTFALFSACNPEVRNYGGGGAAGSGEAVTTSSGGMLCTADDQCGASSECQTFACVNGLCTVSFAPMGTIVTQQAIGDCQVNMCDGKGYVAASEDPVDPADDANPCTTDTCVGPKTTFDPVGAGTPCNGSQFCNGFGLCVQCLSNADCPGGVCFKEQCVSAQCSDGQTNGGETDVDCGGPQCSKCPPGAKCGADADCNSLTCQGGLCGVPTCMDGIPNGLETSIDCGGPDCPPCGTGQVCKSNLDCASKVCLTNICQDAACDDNIMNGNETDVDCGGGTCAKCANGLGCFIYKDCLSGDCCVQNAPMPGQCQPMGSMCTPVVRAESAE